MTKAELARQLGKWPQQLNEVLRDKNPKNIGDKFARQIEDVLGAEKYWLDKEDDDIQLQEMDTSVEGVYLRAIQAAIEFTKARKNWMDSRTMAIRSVEDFFKCWLSDAQLELLPPIGRFDYSLSSHTAGQLSVNLFIPMPGFSTWNIPPFEDERPDFLVVALPPRSGASGVGFYVVSKPDYLDIAKAFKADFVSINLDKSYCEGDSVYLHVSGKTERSFIAVAHQKELIMQLWHKPEVKMWTSEKIKQHEKTE